MKPILLADHKTDFFCPSNNEEMKYEYFLIDGEKYFTAKEIYEKIESYENNRAMKLEINVKCIKISFLDPLPCVEYRRILFYIETNFPVSKIFRSLYIGKNGPDKNFWNVREIYSYAMIFFSNGEIFDIATSQNYGEHIKEKKIPSSLLEEYVWKIHELK